MEQVGHTEAHLAKLLGSRSRASEDPEPQAAAHDRDGGEAPSRLAHSVRMPGLRAAGRDAGGAVEIGEEIRAAKTARPGATEDQEGVEAQASLK